MNSLKKITLVNFSHENVKTSNFGTKGKVVSTRNELLGTAGNRTDFGLSSSRSKKFKLIQEASFIKNSFEI